MNWIFVFQPLNQLLYSNSQPPLIIMRAKTVIMEVVGLLWRYACAILVTLLVWALVVLLGVTVIDKGFIEFLSGANNHPMHPAFFFGIGYTSAFLGILLGGLCLPARSRMPACIILLVMGLTYYMTLWYFGWSQVMHSKHGTDLLLIPLAAGGLCAIWATALASRRAKAAQAKAEGVRSPRALWVSCSWRCYLIGICVGVVVTWVMIFANFTF